MKLFVWASPNHPFDDTLYVVADNLDQAIRLVIENGFHIYREGWKDEGEGAYRKRDENKFKATPPTRIIEGPCAEMCTHGWDF